MKYLTDSRLSGKDLSVENRSSACRDHVPEIIGMALDRSEAVRMILLMTKACVERTNGADLRAFLETAPDIPEIHHIH